MQYVRVRPGRLPDGGQGERGHRRRQLLAHLGRDLPGGQVAKPGAQFANPAPGRDHYQRILDEAEGGRRGLRGQIEAARRTFYDGFVAEAIGSYLERAEVMDMTRPAPGLLSQQI